MSDALNIEALRKVAEEAPALIAYYLRRGPDDLGVGEVERLLTTSSALLSELEAVKGALDQLDAPKGDTLAARIVAANAEWGAYPMALTVTAIGYGDKR